MSQENSPKPPLAGRPKPPKWLHPDAARKFTEVAKLVEQAGYISLLDSDIIALYSSKWAEYQQHVDTIALEGMVREASNKYLQPHPCIAMRDQCERMLKQLGDSLGLNPKARSKLKVSEQEEANPFAEFED